MTADLYVHQCLPLVLHAVHIRRQKSSFTLHHDNAPAHTAAATKEFLASEGAQLMSHSPCSPDLAPCDFFLFPHVKKQLRGTRYDSPQDAIHSFTRAIDSIEKSRGLMCGRAGFSAWSVASKLREGTLKSLHEVRVTALLWLQTFGLTQL